MRIYYIEVLISLSFCIESTLLENIKIKRIIEKKEWTSVQDSFYIPRSICEPGDSRYERYCIADSEICKTALDNRSLCSCPANSSTLTYQNKLWRCRGNREVRRNLGKWSSKSLPRTRCLLPCKAFEFRCVRQSINLIWSTFALVYATVHDILYFKLTFHWISLCLTVSNITPLSST